MNIKLRTKFFSFDKFFNINFNRRYPIVSCGFAFAGIVVGTFLYALKDSVQLGAQNAFSDFCTENSIKSTFEIFVSSFTYNALILAFLCFLGFSAVGFAVVYAAPFFKGLGVGAVCGYIYSAYLLKGVLYSAILVFPSSVIGFLGIILACNESAQMSRDILGKIRKNGDTEEKIRTDLFFLRYAVIVLIILLSSLLFSLGTNLFFRLL